MSKPTIRPAEPADALCLGVLGMQVFLDTYALQGIRPALAREVQAAFSTARCIEHIADPRSVILLAEIDGHLVGFAQLALGQAHELAPAGPPCELFRLYVQEPFTGRRIGSMLLMAAERVAASDGARVLWLTPWVHNHRALGFYAARGYRDFGLSWYLIDGEAHENRVYAKPLCGDLPASG